MQELHPPSDRLDSFSLNFPEPQQLFVAGAACVTAAAAVGMAVCTGIGTVVLTAFFNGGAEVDNAQARRTSAFHLGDGGHFAFSW